MALITMAVHDTESNGRSALTERALDSLFSTVDFNTHKLIIVDNGSCQDTIGIYKHLHHWFMRKEWEDNVRIIYLPENLGTSRALNRAWQLRCPGEHVVKIDNDVVIHSRGWVEEMIETIARMPSIGILGLKRKDIIQTTWHPDLEFRTELIMLPHEPGQRWITLEKSSDVIGTCTMFNSALLDKVGYSFQPGVYGYEDTLFCRRAHLAGFITGFISHINIDHIDPGGNEYIHWKQKHAGEHTDEMIRIFREYLSGARSIYQEFY